MLAGCLQREPARWSDPLTGMAFVRIDGGSFAMGSPEHEPRREAQERQHRAHVAPFWIGTHEVTQQQWTRVMDANPSHFAGDATRPVENITWHDVQTFLDRLNAHTDGGFRLPTEAEWEFACRAGSATAFADGDTLDSTRANVAANIADSTAGRGATRPVGSYPPNAWGLFDMHGNVWEWTADDHCPYSAGEHASPSCGGPLKVIRGGSWYFEADSARCALRYTHAPSDKGFSLGLRLARDDRRRLR